MSLICCFSPHSLQRLPASTPSNAETRTSSQLPADPTPDHHDASRTSVIGLAQAVANSAICFPSTRRHEPGTNPLTGDVSEIGIARPKTMKRWKATLEAIREKLFHRDTDADTSHEFSPVSIGMSQDERARRAELRRIMHKRIQDELQTEQDEDAQINKVESSPHHQSPLSEVAGSAIGPRDIIEFAVCNTHNSSMTSVWKTVSKSTVGGKQDFQPPNNDSVLSKDDVLPQASEVPSCVNDCSNLPLIHTPDEASVTSAQNSCNVSQRSFQLSNASTRLDRILGPGNGFRIRQNSSSLDGQSALGVWLVAQGLRTRDHSILRVDEQTRNSMDTNNSPRLLGLYRNDIEIPAATASDVEDGRALGDTVVDHEQVNMSTTPVANRSMGMNRFVSEESMGGHSSDDVFETRVALSNSNHGGDNTSSNYPSKLPSFQPSPVCSRPNLYSLNLQDLQSFQSSATQWYRTVNLCSKLSRLKKSSSVDCIDSTQCEVFLPQCQRRLEMHPDYPFLDNTSLSQSDTTSFIQREAELRTIEKRFKAVLASQKPQHTVNSRFREEFDAAPFGESGNKSMLGKMHLFVPDRVKLRLPVPGGARLHKLARTQTQRAGTEGCFPRTMNLGKGWSEDISKRGMNANFCSHRRATSLGEDRNTATAQGQSIGRLWQRAIQLDAETGFVSSNNYRGPSQDGTFGHTLQSVAKSPQVDPPPARLRSPNRSQLTPSSGELSAGDSSKWLIDRWVSRMIPKKTSLASCRLESPIKPPRSWSRFPSHTRSERNGLAAAEDNVIPQDFAVRGCHADDHLLWMTDSETRSVSRSTQINQPVVAKFGRVLKARLERLTRSNFNIHTPRRHKRTARRRTPPEFPELQILPTKSGLKELLALEEEIGTSKGSQRNLSTLGQEALHQRETGDSGSKTSARMESSRDAITDRNRVLDDPDDSIKSPSTPSSELQSLIRQSLAMTDVFFTPQSCLSSSPQETKRENSENEYLVRSDGASDIIRPRSCEQLPPRRPRSCTWSAPSLPADEKQ